jgi:hypothetical protein
MLIFYSISVHKCRLATRVALGWSPSKLKSVAVGSSFSIYVRYYGRVVQSGLVSMVPSNLKLGCMHLSSVF